MAAALPFPPPSSSPAPWLERLRPATLGAVDGLVTTFAVVVAGTTADVPPRAIVSVAVATMVADAVSMSVGEFLSSRPLVGFEEAAVLSLACGACFVGFGALPVLAFLAEHGPSSATAAFAAALFWIGGVRAILVRDERADGASRALVLRWAEVMLLGGFAAGVAYATARAATPSEDD